MYQHLAGSRVRRIERFHLGGQGAGSIVYSGFVLLGNVYGSHGLCVDAQKETGEVWKYCRGIQATTVSRIPETNYFWAIKKIRSACERRLFMLLLIPSVDAYVPLRHLLAVRGNRTSWFDECQ